MTMNAEWTTIRTLTAQVGEATTTPSAALAVDLGQNAPRVEVRLASGASTPSVPTSITLHVWRDTNGVDKLGTIDIAAADVAASIPKLFEFAARRVYVTVSFTGGSTPTLTGTIQARPVFGA